MKNKEPMPFFDYIDEINNSQINWNLDGDTYPNTNYKKLNFDRYKKMIYKNTYYRLLNILLNMYKWELPEYLSDRAIELGYCIY